MLAIASIAFVACQKEETKLEDVNNKEVNDKGELKELHFRVKSQLSPLTKTYLTYDSVEKEYTPYWKNGDILGAYLGTEDLKDKALDMTLTNGAVDGAAGNFEGTAVAVGSGTFQAFYPSAAFEKGYSDSGENKRLVGLNIGDKANDYKQYPELGSPDPNCDILLSKACDYVSDGADVVIDDLIFGRPLSILKINLVGSYAADEEVDWLKIATSSGTLSGRVSVSLNTGIINAWTVSKNYAWAEYTTSKPVINHATNKSVYMVVNPTILATGTTITVTGSTSSFDISKSFSLTGDMEFPRGGIAVLNLTIAEANCTPKVVFTPKVYDRITSAADLNIAETIIVHRDKENTPKYYYIPNAKGSKPASKAISGKANVTLAGDLSTITISSADVTDMTWTWDGGDANFSMTSTADATLGMGSTGANDGLSIQTTYKDNTWSIDTHAEHGWDIMHDATSRYLAVYATTNVRTYANNTLNQNAPFIIYQLRDGKTASGIVWSSTSAVASITSSGTTFTPPTLTNTHSLTIAYSSSDTDVATINPSTGAITIVGEGETVIQAYFAGDETYKAIKKRYTLTVTDDRDACVAPTFSPAAGAVAADTEVTISSTTTGSTIYYTTNGDTPTVGGATTTAGTEGTASVTVTIDVAKTIKAIAVKSPSNKNSTVSTAEYTITGSELSGLAASWSMTSGETTSLSAGSGNTSATLTTTNSDSNKVKGFSAGIASQKMNSGNYWLFTIPSVANVLSTTEVTIQFSGVKVNNTTYKGTYQLEYSWNGSDWTTTGSTYTETTTASSKSYTFTPGEKASGTLYIRYRLTSGGGTGGGSHYLGSVTLSAE